MSIAPGIEPGKIDPSAAVVGPPEDSELFIPDILAKNVRFFHLRLT
jgi:hypothetical protein